MSAAKLTPPADAPKIPKGWVYMGVDWVSNEPVRYACWMSPNEGWDGIHVKELCRTNPSMDGTHYITPAPKRAKKKAGTKVTEGGALSPALIRRAANQGARIAVREIETSTGTSLPMWVCAELVQSFAKSISAIGIKGARK